MQNTELLLRWKFPDSIQEFLQDYDAVLLENHGALTYSDTLMNAYHRMESVEFYARLMYQARMLGGPKIIPLHTKWKS